MASIIDTLITDRTQDDVDRVQELKKKILTEGLQSLTVSEYTEYFNGMRGAYNATDLNRVGEASNYVYGLLKSFGLRPKGYVNQKTDWTVRDVPTSEQMDDYVNSIRLLRDAVSVIITMPINMDNLTYDSANRIERVLIAAEEAAMEYKNKMYYCGELCCGEVTA